MDGAWVRNPRREERLGSGQLVVGRDERAARIQDGHAASLETVEGPKAGLDTVE